MKHANAPVPFVCHDFFLSVHRIRVVISLAVHLLCSLSIVETTAVPFLGLDFLTIYSTAQSFL